MNEADTIRKHIKTLYALFGVLVVAFLILAVAVWYRSPEAMLKDELRDLSFQMSQNPLPAHEYAALQRLGQQSLEDRIAEAKAIVVCKHTTHWGRIKCEVTDILKHDEDFNLPYQVGSPISSHERKIEKEDRAAPGEGMITFLTGSAFSPSSALVIHDGKVTDAHADPSRPASDPYVTREFTVEQIKEMIEAANKRLESYFRLAPEKPQP